MVEPFLITVEQHGAGYLAKTAGTTHEAGSMVSARLAALALMQTLHGSRHFLKFRVTNETATFRVTPMPPKTFGGRRG